MSDKRKPGVRIHIGTRRENGHVSYRKINVIVVHCTSRKSIKKSMRRIVLRCRTNHFHHLSTKTSSALLRWSFCAERWWPRYSREAQRILCRDNKLPDFFEVSGDTDGIMIYTIYMYISVPLNCRMYRKHHTVHMYTRLMLHGMYHTYVKFDTGIHP